MPVKKLCRLLKTAIQDYASEGSRWQIIGGKISIAILNETGMVWLENEPDYPRWGNIKEMIADYRQGKQKINLIAPTTQKNLNDLFATVK